MQILTTIKDLLSGKKSYIMATLIVTLGTLTALGVFTPEDMTNISSGTAEWAEKVGGIYLLLDGLSKIASRAALTKTSK